MGKCRQDPNDYYDQRDFDLMDDVARVDTPACAGECRPTCRWCEAKHECPVECGGGDGCPYVALDAEQRGLMRVVQLMRPPAEVTRPELVALVGQGESLTPGARLALADALMRRGWRWRLYTAPGVPVGAVAVDHGRWRALYLPLVPEVKAPFEVDGMPSPF